MRQYESYKDSGVEWIGKIPSHWETMKLKYSFQIFAGATPQTGKAEYWDGDIIWITPADFKTTDKYVSKGQRTITKAGYNSCNTQLVPQGSLIFSKRAPIGTVAISTNELCTNQGCLSCVPQKTNVLYQYYCASISADYFDLLGAGTTFKEISALSFSNVKFPCPPFKEQIAIASYLDEKTSRIDRIIKSREEKIKLLEELRASIISNAVTKGIRKNVEMKDSGIDWIGSVPSHWTKCRIKNIASLITEPSTSSIKIGLEQIESKTGLFIDIPVKYDGNGVAFKKNDIVYGKLRPYLQKVWLASFEGNAVGDFFVYRCLDNCLPEFLHYFMLSDGFTSSCNGATFGAKMPRVPSEYISSMRFFLPTKEEQKEIVNFIHTRLCSISKTIYKERNEISLLKEYRASLITEVVTGKRKVI